MTTEGQSLVGLLIRGPSLVPKALFLCLEDLSGKKFTHAHDQWIALMPTAEEAANLELPSGAPVVHVVHVARAEDGTALEVSESIWPANRVMVIDDYPIEQQAEEPDTPSEV